MIYSREQPFNKLRPKWNFFFLIILSFFGLIVVAPMALVVIISFSSEASISNVGYTFVPQEWSTEGYQYLFKMGDQVVRSYLVTIFYSVVGTAMSVAVMAMYAYVLSIKNFWLHKQFTWILFFTMLFGGGLVPSYILNVRYLHLNDTIWILLLPGLVSAYNVIILRTFITTTIPNALLTQRELTEQATLPSFSRLFFPYSKRDWQR